MGAVRFCVWNEINAMLNDKLLLNYLVPFANALWRNILFCVVEQKLLSWCRCKDFKKSKRKGPARSGEYLHSLNNGSKLNLRWFTHYYFTVETKSSLRASVALLPN